MEAEVTDKANQIQKSRKEIPITKDDLIIEVYPEGGSIKPKLKNIINIVASYPNGTPAQVEIGVNAYTNRNNLDRAKLYNIDESELTGKIKTNVYGLAQFKLELEYYYYKADLSIEAKDSKGNLAKISKSFNVENKYEYVLVRPDKYISRIGDTLHLDVLTSGNKNNIYIDIIKNSQTLLTKSVRTESGTASLDIYLSPEMAGTLEIHAYKILSSSDITRDAKIIFVDQPMDIAISSKLDSSQYKPGETAKIDFEVSNKSNPQQAALGITAVDESVFSLAEEQAGLEKIYFLLEKQILESKLDVHGFSIEELVNNEIKSDYEVQDGNIDVEAENIKTENIEAARQNMAGIILAQASSSAEFGLSVNTNAEKEVEVKRKMAGNFGVLANLSLFLFMLITVFIFISAWREIRRSGGLSKFFKAVIAVLFLCAIAILMFKEVEIVQAIIYLFVNLASFFLILLLIVLFLASLLGVIKHGLSRRFFKVFSFVLLILTLWTAFKFLAEIGNTGNIFGFLLVSLLSMVLLSFFLGNVISFIITIIKRDDPVLSKMFVFTILFAISLAFLGYFTALSGNAFLLSLFEGHEVMPIIIVGGVFSLVFLAWLGKIMLLIKEKKYEISLSVLLSTIIVPMTFLALATVVSTVILSDNGGSGSVFNDARRVSPNIERGGGPSISAWGSTQRPQNVPTDLNSAIFSNPLKGTIGDLDLGGNEPIKKEMNLGLDRQKQTEAKKAPRIRELFPETLYYNPIVITDKNGKAQVEIPLADSITSWRVSALASTKDGEFGNANIPIVVFQDFFIDLDLPVSLTQDDEISIPVAVYNYLSDKQDIEINIEKAGWFELMDSESKSISLEKNGIGSVYFRIKVNKIGFHNLTVKAFGSSLSDAIKRSIEVVPNGKKIENSINNSIKDKKSETVIIPSEAIKDSRKVYAKIYPRFISQVVEGMDGILAMPHGCFEQTSSTTYPNVLVLDYTQKTKQITPEIQMKAEQYINVGYQRLVSFEVDGGGFSLYGKSPANEILTAYGLMEFSDMSNVYDVDQKIIERTAKWLASKQKTDGYWDVSGGYYHESSGAYEKIKNSAYILWSLVKAGYSGPEIAKGISYLKNNWGNINDTYALAVIANVFLDSGDEKSGSNVLDKLIGLKAEEKDSVYWPSSSETYMGGRENSANIETTAYTIMALRKADREPEISEKALDWMIKQKDSRGLWGSTKTTVAAMQTLIYAVEKQNTIEGKLELKINNGTWKEVEITKENSDVMKIIDLTPEIAGSENIIDMRYKGESSVYYQIDFSYYIPWDNFFSLPVAKSPIKINVSYDNNELRINDTIKASVELTNSSSADANLVIADIGVPAGFVINTDDLDYLVQQGEKNKASGLGVIERYEIAGRQIIFYLDKLNRNQKISFWYRLTAKYPIKAKSFPSSIYEYYNPDTIDTVKPAEIRVD